MNTLWIVYQSITGHNSVYLIHLPVCSGRWEQIREVQKDLNTDIGKAVHSEKTEIRIELGILDL